jgi:hypothetical protein
MFDALVGAARDVQDGLTQRMESKLMRAAKTLAGDYDPVTAANCLREDLSGAGGKWNAQVFADSVMPDYEASMGDGAPAGGGRELKLYDYEKDLTLDDVRNGNW